QPLCMDGVMVSFSKDNRAGPKTRKGHPIKDPKAVDFRLKAPVFSDVYTGRILQADEALDLRKKYNNFDAEKVQLYFDLPEGSHAYDSVADLSGTRINPMTGEKEPRQFPKTYGCDGGYRYGDVVTMRSGTGAFYDIKTESGTVFVSGPRSGCTNSIIPANGLLNLPLFTDGCVCSYPLPAGTALVSRPQTDEQWAVWGAQSAASLNGKLQRVGVNFGAPGDRMTRDGTLWLDTPAIGGPSPELELELKPATAKYYYRHSLWMKGGEGWPWVAASGVVGLEQINLHGLKPANYTVRLTFFEPEKGAKAGDRVFDVKIQGKVLARSVDPVAQSGGVMRAVTLSFKKEIRVSDGQLSISLVPRKGQTIISGVEVIAQ
ncbi:MAG: hypothetical protein GXP30_01050, partial [Verrucomicrobia bacterium]|nr:hypothetical protein [Verrucomicrobiota bacterium]